MELVQFTFFSNISFIRNIQKLYKCYPSQRSFIICFSYLENIVNNIDFQNWFKIEKSLIKVSFTFPDSWCPGGLLFYVTPKKSFNVMDCWSRKGTWKTVIQRFNPPTTTSHLSNTSPGVNIDIIVLIKYQLNINNLWM